MEKGRISRGFHGQTQNSNSRSKERDSSGSWMGSTSDLYIHSHQASLPSDNGFRTVAEIKKLKQDPQKLEFLQAML